MAIHFGLENRDSLLVHLQALMLLPEGITACILSRAASQNEALLGRRWSARPLSKRRRREDSFCTFFSMMVPRGSGCTGWNRAVCG